MSRLKDLMVEIGFDVSDVEKGIGKLSKQFDNLGKEFVKKAVKRAPKDPFNIGAERTRTQKFIKELKDLGQEVGSYQKKLKTLKTPEQFKEFRSELKQYKKDYFEFQDAVSDKQLKTFKDNLQREEDLKKKLIEKEKSKQKAIQKIKDDERKTIYDRNKRKGEAIRDERQARLKASQDAQKALQNRLKDFKKAKQKELNQHKATNKEKLSDTERYLKRARRLEEQLRFSANFRRLPDQEKNRFEGQIKSARKLMVTEGSDYGFRKLSSDVREFRRSLIGLHTVQMGLTDSARNMLRAYASVFALVESTAAINRVGQDFESMRASMLAASTSAEDSQQKLAFVKNEARRLGIDLVAASKAYMQLSIAGKDALKQNQLDDLFVSSMEAATAFGMSLDDTKGTFRAFIQI